MLLTSNELKESWFLIPKDTNAQSRACRFKRNGKKTHDDLYAL